MNYGSNCKLLNSQVFQLFLVPFQHTVSKRYTQKIERKHLTYRTRIKRLARKTICFSKSELMYDTVIGLFINRFEARLLKGIVLQHV